MKTYKIRGGLLGRETKKQMECLKDIIITILSAESTYIKQNSSVNNELFKQKIKELNNQEKILKNIIVESSKTFRIFHNFKRDKKTSDYENYRNQMIDILIELIERIGLTGNEEEVESNYDLLSIFYYFRDLIKILMCIKINNNKHDCDTGYKNVYDYLIKYYCGSKKLTIINDNVKTILKTQPLENSISSMKSSITNSPNSTSYHSAKSSASYFSAKSTSKASGKHKTRRRKKN
jgi:hypothetical protein